MFRQFVLLTRTRILSPTRADKEVNRGPDALTSKVRRKENL
jgi:hypothetical protein